jgi:hypothetical protein
MENPEVDDEKVSELTISSSPKVAVARALVGLAKELMAAREDYPDGFFKDVTITLKFDPEDGRCMIHCPEWHYEGPGGADPSVPVARLVKEIVKHNKEELAG